MASFGKKSNEKIGQCHGDWRTILEEAIKVIDFSVYEGHRDPELQLKYFAEGKSKVKFGKHNLKPSMAVDVAPYPIDFSNGLKKIARFYYLAGVIKTVAKNLYSQGRITTKVRWGGDWDGDNDFEDQTFDDLCHFELKH